MSAYHYRITVDRIHEVGDAASPEGAGHHSLSFNAVSHDDILAIVDRVQSNHGFDAATAASLAVGLKLFSEILLRQRHHPQYAPLFAPLHQPMREFLQGLKSPAQPEPVS